MIWGSGAGLRRWDLRRGFARRAEDFWIRGIWIRGIVILALIVAALSPSLFGPAWAVGQRMTDDLDCLTLTDFSTSQQRNWVTVNDNVMGGRSVGGASYQGSHMVFSGRINTNGGGFSSVRMGVSNVDLGGYDRFVVRYRPDDRVYQLTLRTRLAYRGRVIAYRAALPQGAQDGLDGDGWVEAALDFDALEPSIFGQRVRAPGFDARDAQSLGLIIADGRDGVFSLDVDWIKACRSASPSPG